jgi:O-antigen ligase
MYWFTILFPFLIYPWNAEHYDTVPKFVYLISFVTVVWTILIVIRRKWFTYLPRVYTPVEGLLTVYFGLIVLSTIFSVDQHTSIYGTEYRYEGLISLICYGSLLIFAYRLVNPSSIEKILKGIVIVSVVVSIYGIMQHFLIDFLPRHETKIGSTRSYAFFDNPNFFGSYVVIMILICIYLFLKETKLIILTYYYLAVVIIFVAMIYSGTRSAWVGFATGVLFLTLFVIWKKKDLWKKWILILLTVVSLFFLLDKIENGGFQSRAKTIITESTAVVTKQTTGHEGSNRYFIWEKSVSLIPDYFWLGTGPDTLKFVFPATHEELTTYMGDPNMIVDKVHNEYIQIAVTTGVPALLIYISLLVYIFVVAFKAMKVSNQSERLLLYGLLAAILGYMAQALFNISVVPVAPFFWILLGFTYGLSLSIGGQIKN